MTIKEVALKHYLENDRNCAEAVLLGASEVLGLGVSPDAVHALGTFGGGMGCGETCGAPSGAIAALGLLLIKEKAHDSPAARDASSAYILGFLEEFHTLRCAELKPVYFDSEQRCAGMVAAAAERLDMLYASLQKSE